MRSMAFDFEMIPDKIAQVPPYYAAVLSTHFYSSLLPSFTELGVLSAEGEWREEAFQKLLFLLHRAETYGFTPSVEMMRLWMNDFIDLKGRIYEGLKQGMTPAAALRNAQRRLRDATNQELHGMDEPASAGDGIRISTQEPASYPSGARDAKAHPFSHPIFWAGFTVYGG